AVTLPASHYPDQQRKAELYSAALEKLAAMPGTQAAAVFTTTPLSNNGVVWTRFRTERQQELKPEDLPGGILQSISSDYFDVLRIPLLRGRRFTRADATGAVPVAVINERLARRFFPGSDAVGKRLKIEDTQRSRWMEILNSPSTGRSRRRRWRARSSRFAQQPIRSHSRHMSARALLNSMANCRS